MNIYSVINIIDTDSIKMESVINSCETPLQLMSCLNWLSSIRKKWTFLCKKLKKEDYIYCSNHINDQYTDLLNLINNDNLRCG